jgi:AcrR family transcriptional regulator
MKGVTMPDKFRIEFAESKQDRSKQTLDDILEAASNLIEQADPDLFTSRVLAAESGYSIGTLNKRLISIDNVFIWLIEQGQKRYIRNASRIIEDFDTRDPLVNLLESLIDTFFTAMKKVNPKVIQYYEHRVAIRIGFQEDFDRIDAMVKPFLAASQSNKSNTFRQMDETEMRLILRSLLFFVERPFVYDDPIAGTIEHRRIAIENSVRLLGQ